MSKSIGAISMNLNEEIAKTIEEGLRTPSHFINYIDIANTVIEVFRKHMNETLKKELLK